MEFTGGKSRRDPVTGEWISNPRVYTDFHCSLKEWKNLNRGRLNFINQLLQEIWYDESVNKEDFNFIHPIEDKIPYPVFSEIPEKDGKIISYCIQRVTGLKSKCYVNTYYSESSQGSIDNVIVEFDNYDKNILPNIVILIDAYNPEPEPDVIKMTLDAVYQAVKNFKYESFNKYYKPYYNNNYDLIINNVKDKTSIYYNTYHFPDIFRPKNSRKINRKNQISW
jgi:hypothetical protein